MPNKTLKNPNKTTKQNPNNDPSSQPKQKTSKPRRRLWLLTQWHATSNYNAINIAQVDSKKKPPKFLVYS